MNFLFRVSDFLYRIITLNVLWVFFVILGLGVFGFMPATVAVYSVTRRWLLGEDDVPMFKTFLFYYKKEFVKSNLVGIIFMFFSYLVYLNFIFIDYSPETVGRVLFYILVSVSFIIAITFINIFPVMAHYEFSVINYIRAAGALAFLHPLRMLMQLVWIVGYWLVIINFMVLIPLIGVSTLFYFLMWLNFDTFKFKIENEVKEE
ncbi:YesL family protein [Bacillus alkalicellulosilyticus]|uniref:YesL family protein n=1 Tax=Alkalihalobacterium alkalicellulosilyticum TaxID=1912214 RepID=UPI00099868AD|nr:DUF624 domain-containing protein [Bacillus alkalicellulosilyticus]